MQHSNAVRAVADTDGAYQAVAGRHGRVTFDLFGFATTVPPTRVPRRPLFRQLNRKGRRAHGKRLVVNRDVQRELEDLLGKPKVVRWIRLERERFAKEQAHLRRLEAGTRSLRMRVRDTPRVLRHKRRVCERGALNTEVWTPRDAVWMHLKVLEQSLLDLVERAATSEVITDIWQWIDNSDDRRGFAFYWCCRLVGWEPDTIRMLLEPLRSGRRRQLGERKFAELRHVIEDAFTRITERHPNLKWTRPARAA